MSTNVFLLPVTITNDITTLTMYPVEYPLTKYRVIVVCLDLCAFVPPPPQITINFHITVFLSFSLCVF